MLPRNVEQPEAVKRLDDAKNLGLAVVVSRDYGPVSRFEHCEGKFWTEEMMVDGRTYYMMGHVTEGTVRKQMQREETEYKLVDES